VRVVARGRCDGMQCDKTPTIAQLAALPCASPPSVCASSLSMGTTCILRYRAYHSSTSLPAACVTLPRWRSRRLPRKTHSSYLEARPGKGSGNIVVMTQFGVQGAGPATHAPVCQPDTCQMPTQALIRHPSSWHLPLPGVWPPVSIIAALSGIPPSPVATGQSPIPPSHPIRLYVC
jgi:hypothetical protein